MNLFRDPHSGEMRPFQGPRLTFFRAVIIVSFGLLVLRLAQMQFVQGSEYLMEAEELRLQKLPIQAPRGEVYDVNGVLLAGNVAAFNVSVIPAEFSSNGVDISDAGYEVLFRLYALIDVPATRETADEAGRFDERSLEEMVDEGLRIAPYRAVVVTEDVEKDVAMQLRERQASLPGVQIDVIPLRQYPTGDLTGQLIGFMGPIPPERVLELQAQGYNAAYDRIGYDGIEFSLESVIAGQQGTLWREVDIAGQPMAEIRRTDPVAGLDVRLTLDTRLQEFAQEALLRRQAIVNTDPDIPDSHQGVVVAMNPKNGEILAMVSLPTYDNSRFARAIDVAYYEQIIQNRWRPMINHAIASIYPPGSAWKVIVAGGALEEDVITPQSELTCEGSMVVKNRYAPNDPAASQTFVCWNREGHGPVDLLKGLAQSCDIYFYQVGGGNEELSWIPTGLGITNMHRYATSFGVGDYSGIELPGERAVRMPDREWKRRTWGENWSTGDSYNASIGQGYVNVTVLQLTNVIAAFANGGTLYRPHIVDAYIDRDGTVIEDIPPQIIRTIRTPAPGEKPVLLPVEDLFIQGGNSIFCACDPTSEYYDEAYCDPENYEPVYIVRDENDAIIAEVPYTVNLDVPGVFDQGCREELIRTTPFEPAFLSPNTIEWIQRGMREVVLTGTGTDSNLGYVNVAGKTSTAEYCDEIALERDLCRPGDWPSHAWYSAYAPYEDPEIAVVAFLYNASEGSLVALPVVTEVLEEYFRLKDEDALGTTPEEPVNAP